MGEMVYWEEMRPHCISEVICIHCGRRWIAVYPADLWLKDVSCACGRSGGVIKTGQWLENAEAGLGKGR